MPRKVRASSELQRVIRGERGAFLIVYDSRRHAEDYIERLSDALSQAFEPGIPVVAVDVDADRGLLSVVEIGEEMLPVLMLYLHGRRVWVQYGLFYSLSYDKLAVRTGVRRALEVYGLKPRDLGIDLLRLLF